uniref:Uncharacterized protein n=1 Tax=Aegilops tauschii subsp. strangulata TaxID=200361 RepID=A0A453SGK2_AEGTS
MLVFCFVISWAIYFHRKVCIPRLVAGLVSFLGWAGSMCCEYRFWGFLFTAEMKQSIIVQNSRFVRT